MDTRTPEQRRKIMQAVGTKNTGPEIAVRRMLFRLGYRYRLHDKKLPGSPDIVFTARKKVIFVNGCYWHGHGCRKGQLPKSNNKYWLPKIEANRCRDKKNQDMLEDRGWKTLVIWQCDLENLDEVMSRLIKFLGAPQKNDRLSAPVPVT